jgi:hypothetical protein
MLVSPETAGPERDLWPGVRSRLANRVAAAPEAGRSRLRRQRGLALAGAAVLVALAVFSFWPRLPVWEGGEAWAGFEDPAAEMVWEDPWAGGAPRALFTALQEPG